MENEEVRQTTGACQYCGQSRMVEMSEDEWLEKIQKTNWSAQKIANYIATTECNCKEGAEFRQGEHVIEQCDRNIEIMFREEYPVIADIMQEVKRSIWCQTIKNMTITTPEGHAASISRRAGQLKVKYKTKTEMEMTASW